MSDRSNDVREDVRKGYGAIAEAGSWSAAREGVASDDAASCCGGGGGGVGGRGGGGGCCGGSVMDSGQIAVTIGYSDDDLAGVPEGANLGLGCGNPTALAGLREGEVVLDLGSGAGLDCYIAAPRVGASGRVIGVDMTPEMINKARGGLAGYRERTGLDNMEFRLGEIEHIPAADGSVDVVMSNCVINLSPDHRSVWNEIGRVLKPGGRVAVSDLALRRPLPAAVREDVEALVGCVAGAKPIAEIRSMMEGAGLVDIELTEKPAYVDAMTDTGDPLYARVMAHLAAGETPGDYIVSLDIAGRKPGG